MLAQFRKLLRDRQRLAMIDGSARRIVLAGIGCPRGDVDQGGDLRVHSHIRHDHSRKGVAYPIRQISVRATTGLSVTRQNSWGRYADVPPPGMFVSVMAAACGFGNDADERNITHPLRTLSRKRTIRRA